MTWRYVPIGPLVSGLTVDTFVVYDDQVPVTTPPTLLGPAAYQCSTRGGATRLVDLLNSVDYP